MREVTSVPQLSEEQLNGIIDRALVEDIGPGDVTSGPDVGHIGL